MLLQIRFLLVALLTFQMVYSDEDPVKPRAGVLILDKLNFDEEIKEGVVLVHFYSPTNPSCKAVAPILEELAPKVASDGIKIGKVDCRAADNFNRQLCADNRVSNRNVKYLPVRRSLFRKKRLMLDEKFQQNASKFTIFYIYENPKLLLPFFISCYFFIFP